MNEHLPLVCACTFGSYPVSCPEPFTRTDLGVHVEAIWVFTMSGMDKMARSGSGAGIIRVAAGAVHGDVLPPGTPASHGYSIGAIIANAEGKLRLRIWPRRWSEPNKEFRVDVDNVREGQTFAEHSIDDGLHVEALQKS